MRHFIFLLSFFFLTSFAVAEEFHIYVAPNGNDSASGTLDQPLASLEGARDTLRELRKSGTLKPGTAVKVTFQSGSYTLLKPVAFTAEDSGTVEAPVTFEAAPGAEVRFTGSVPLADCQKLTDEQVLAKLPEAARGNVVVWDLPAMGFEGVTSEKPIGAKNPQAEPQLINNDQPQTLARWPNEGFIDVAGIPDEEKAKEKEARAEGKNYRTQKFFWKADPETDAHITKWRDELEPRGAGFWKYNWAGDLISLGEIDPETRTITPTQPGSGYGYGPITNAWFGFNLLCELDAPGEYYFDRLTGKLYYWPTDPKRLKKSSVTMGTDLVQLTKTSFVTFNGITFENCRGTALKLTEGESVRVTRCVVRNVGVTGISITKGLNHRIAGCDISFTDGTGVSVWAGEPKTLTHCGHVIENNHIHHFSRRQMTYHPAVQVGGCGTTVARNLIHEGPHTAVLFGGRENQFLENEVHSVCLNSGEMGAFYCGRDFTLVGNVMDGNYVHDIYNPRGQRNRAYMLDDGAAGLSITNSWVENVAEGISLSAVGNVIEGCTFINCQPAISCWQKWENPETDYTNPGYTHKQLLTILAEVPVNDSPWIDRYPWLAQLQKSIDSQTLRAPETRTVVRKNRAFNCAAPWMAFMMGERYAYSEKTWLVEKNDVQTDVPREKLPVYSGKAGVYQSPERVTWPVKHEVNKGCGKLTFE